MCADPGRGACFCGGEPGNEGVWQAFGCGAGGCEPEPRASRTTGPENRRSATKSSPTISRIKETMSKKHQSLSVAAVQIKINRDGSRVLHVEVDRASLHRSIISLTLLLFEKIQLIEFPGKFVIISDNEEQSKSRFIMKGKVMYLELIRRDLEFVMGFLLDYERDGFAPVDHIDVELSDPTIKSNTSTLIILAKDFGKPLSAQELNKLLS